MEFFATIVFLIYVNAFAGVREVRRADNRSKLIGQAHWIIVMPVMMAVFVAIMSDGDTGTGWVPLTAFAAGVFSIMLFGFKLYRMHSAQPDTSALGWRSGLSALAIAGGLYVAYAAVDHWLFFRDDKESGTASAQFLGVEEIKCDRMILIRTRGETMDYRCPTSVVFGRLTPRPFAPWPAYTEGESVKLKIVVDTIRNGTFQIPEDVADRMQ